jgi:hypothetical protein
MFRESYAHGEPPHAQNAGRTRLARELESIGIRCIDPERVRRHQRSELAKLRPGALRHLAPPLALLFKATWSLTLYPLAVQLGKPALGRYFTAVLILAAAGLAGLWFNPAAAILCIPAAAMLASILGSILLYLTKSFDAVANSWLLQPLRGFDFSEESIPSMPIRYEGLAKCAELIPGARAMIEYLGDDPFLTIVRGWGPFEEKVRIAAWNTGDRHLDSFASW